MKVWTKEELGPGFFQKSDGSWDYEEPDRCPDGQRHFWVWYESGEQASFDPINDPGEWQCDGYAECARCELFSWWPRTWGQITYTSPQTEQLADFFVPALRECDCCTAKREVVTPSP